MVPAWTFGNRVAETSIYGQNAAPESLRSRTGDAFLRASIALCRDGWKRAVQRSSYELVPRKRCGAGRMNVKGDQRDDDILETVRVGEIIASKYRVERVLGAGGMGVVVAAYHLQLDELVAIKFLLAGGAHNPELVARFEREARAAVRIKNERVARTLDVGKLDNGSPYIVMEYLDGVDLASWLRKRGPLPIEEAVEYVLQTCEALADAHVHGVVHRDIKPENLFVVRQSDGLMGIKVLDFGIAKTNGSRGSERNAGMTGTKAVMGSPLYMSPEQMESTRSVDARTDIWALGAVLYELLGGCTPFQADSMPELVVKILTRPPEPLLGHRRDAPKGLERIVLRCLEKDRNRRFRNVAELAGALVQFGSTRAQASADRVQRTIDAATIPTATVQPITSPERARTQTVGTVDSWERSNAGSKLPRRGRLRLAIVGLVSLLMGAAAVAFAMNWAAKRRLPASASIGAINGPAMSATERETLQRAPASPTENTVKSAPPLSPDAGSYNAPLQVSSQPPFSSQPPASRTDQVAQTRSVTTKAARKAPPPPL
jgi:serine/threonine protein kinase